MNTPLRSHLAAAGPGIRAAAGSSSSAAAAQHDVLVQPAIHGLTLNSNAGLAPGAVLRLQVKAAPGAQRANVVLGQSGVKVALHEEGAGNYVGRYRVQRTDRIDPMQRITARLRYSRGSIAHDFSFPPSFQAAAMGAARRADQRPPLVSQLLPANGERTEEHGLTLIQARLADAGSGVDARSVRLYVDGLEVTADARITEDEVAYRERLGRGTHRAELVVRDRAGNVSRTAWTFRVV
jgi:hypothetical protein